MQWRSFCQVCERFLVCSGRDDQSVGASADRHSCQTGHLVAFGLWSCLRGRFVFTPLYEIMPEEERPVHSGPWGPLTYYPPDSCEKETCTLIFNYEENQGNLWDNIVKTLEEAQE